MSDLFHEGQRSLQDAFETRRIADRLAEVNVRAVFTDGDRAFIEGACFFFLATADTQGRPNVSYKGGAPGLVRVVGPSELAYPDFDGNGMFMSLGNVAVNPHVGMLFIDFQEARRLVVRGTASFSREDPLLASTVGAQSIVRVQAVEIYPNCPRYVHRMTLAERSEYVPQAGAAPIEPRWKSRPEFRDFVHVRQPVATGDVDE